MYCGLQWAVGVLRNAMGGMPGQATHQKVHLPALTNANARLNFSLLLCFSLLSICAEGNWGCAAVCNGLLVFCRLRWEGCRAKRCTKRRVAQPLYPAHRHLQYVLLLCFSFLRIFVEGNGVFTMVCYVLHGMLGGATH